MRPTAELMRAAPFFGSLPDDALIDLASESYVLELPQSTVFMEQGDKPSHLCYLITGLAHYSSTISDRSAVVVELQPGCVFSIDATVVNYPLLGNYCAASESTVVMLPSGIIRSLLHTHLEFSLQVLETLALASRNAKRLVNSLAVRRGTERVAAWLLAKSGSRTHDPVYVKVKKAHLAQMCAMGPETLSRSLFELKSYGVSATSDGIIVSDVSRLLQIAPPHLAFDDLADAEIDPEAGTTAPLENLSMALGSKQ